jgi:MFS superfamily sulfate permease-like transporter
MSLQSTKVSITRRGRIARLPIVAWLPNYDRGWLRRRDRRLTLGAGRARSDIYAGIAGLPPNALSHTLTALLVYAIFGSSRHLVMQATAATAALLAGTIFSFGVSAADPVRYQAYASALVIVTGLVFLAAALARLGFITQFLSKPVMDGFVTGLAIFVAIGQLNKLFGVERGEGNTLIAAGDHPPLPGANWVTLPSAHRRWRCSSCCRGSTQLPSAWAFGFIALELAPDLSGRFGVAVVGVLPAGLPALTWPQIPLLAWAQMVLPAIGILLVAYSEALGVAREFAEKHGYEVDPDQELYAHAFANIASGLFGGMLASGSMSASAVKEGAGARSQVTTLVTWGAALVTVALCTATKYWRVKSSVSCVRPRRRLAEVRSSSSWSSRS